MQLLRSNWVKLCNASTSFFIASILACSSLSCPVLLQNVPVANPENNDNNHLINAHVQIHHCYIQKQHFSSFHSPSVCEYPSPSRINSIGSFNNILLQQFTKIHRRIANFLAITSSGQFTFYSINSASTAPSIHQVTKVACESTQWICTRVTWNHQQQCTSIVASGRCAAVQLIPDCVLQLQIRTQQYNVGYGIATHQDSYSAQIYTSLCNSYLHQESQTGI